MNKKLVQLYQNISKHSNYQILSNKLKSLVDTSGLTVKSRFEKERMDFIKESTSFQGKRVLDVGGNTGYFSFEVLEAGAREVVYYEGNKEHSAFVMESKRILNLPLQIHNKYFDFDIDLENNEKYDIVLLLNVLHHFGDDFGDKGASIEKAKQKIKDSINYFYNKTDYLILQLGFCWKGDRNQLLFQNGTKKEMIYFIKESTNDNWEMVSIGIAEVKNGITNYVSSTPENLKRNDAIGEFRNRPIFILKSKHYVD